MALALNNLHSWYAIKTNQSTNQENSVNCTYTFCSYGQISTANTIPSVSPTPTSHV